MFYSQKKICITRCIHEFYWWIKNFIFVQMGGNHPGGMLVPDPHFHPAPPQPGGPWMFHHPPPGHFMHPGGPHPMMMTPGGMQPVPWGMAPHPVGPDGVPLMPGPMGPPPPPPPGS